MAKEGAFSKEHLESILDSMEGGVLAMDGDASITFLIVRPKRSRVIRKRKRSARNVVIF